MQTSIQCKVTLLTIRGPPGHGVSPLALHIFWFDLSLRLFIEDFTTQPEQCHHHSIINYKDPQ